MSLDEAKQERIRQDEKRKAGGSSTLRTRSTVVESEDRLSEF